jgi:hypothetical protein
MCEQMDAMMGENSQLDLLSTQDDGSNCNNNNNNMDYDDDDDDDDDDERLVEPLDLVTRTSSTQPLFHLFNGCSSTSSSSSSPSVHSNDHCGTSPLQQQQHQLVIYTISYATTDATTEKEAKEEECNTKKNRQFKEDLQPILNEYTNHRDDHGLYILYCDASDPGMCAFRVRFFHFHCLSLSGSMPDCL